MNTPEPAYTIDELMSVCIARQVVDGEVLAQGINTPLVMAGYILAKLTHAPDVVFASAIAQGITPDWSPLSILHAEADWLQLALMHAGFAAATADLLPRYHPKEFFRPAQVDASGNTNNISLGSDTDRPRLRLPGSGGIPDVTTASDRVYLYVPRHSRLVFVESVDVISGLGHTPQRKRGSGPRYLISDLGQFDWHNGAMRLLTHHPGVSVERIRQKTGFALQTAVDLQPTQPPSYEELRLLREVIDPYRIRKLETLAGSARKAHLRAIIAAEQQRRLNG